MENIPAESCRSTAGLEQFTVADRKKICRYSQCWHISWSPDPYCLSPHFTSYNVSFPSWKRKAINPALIHCCTLSSQIVVISECPDLNECLHKLNHSVVYRFLVVNVTPFSLIKALFSADHECFWLWSFYHFLNLFYLLLLSERMEL